MSEEVDRKGVLKNIKVQTSVKNDCSWIKSGNNQLDPVIQKEKTKPVPAKKSQLVLQATKKFESENTAPSLPAQKTSRFPNKGDSANQGKFNPVSKDAPSKESQVETKEDIKLQSTTEQLVQNYKAQEDKLVPNRGHKEVEANVLVDKPGVNVNEKVGEVVKKEDQTQPDALGKQNNDVVSPVKQEEPSPANKTAEVKEHVDAPTELSNMNNTEDKSSADAEVESCVTKASAEGGTSANLVPATVPAVTQVEPKPKVEPLTKTEPAKNEIVKDASVEVSSTKGSSEKCPSAESNKVSAPFKPKLLPETSDLAAEAGKHASLHARVDSAPPVKSVSSSLAKPSKDSPTESSCENHPAEQDENKVLVIGVVLESPAVVNAAPTQEASPLISVQPLSITLPESPAAESSFRSAVCEVNAAAPAEPAPKTRTEEVVEHKVRSVDFNSPEDSITPPLEDAFDHVMVLDIKDAFELEPAADTREDLVNKLVVDPTDALDFDAASNESTKPKDSEQTLPEEQKRKIDDTNVRNHLKKPAGEICNRETPKKDSIRSCESTCYYCNTTIDGKVRIIVNEPAIVCHEECLKCGVCAKVLGDLLTAMFQHKHLIHCKDCFTKAVHLD
ncbi:zinc finger protein 185 isoform X1 [Nothobranchius furzeri]|uniref:Transcript variant X1 n=2 Tax=Nothobranchius furzeri TaxID=105023 RepID=A0A9D3BGB1_NOTFU|nr:transcript variant X1 [Nothobranchius furzeri]